MRVVTVAIIAHSDLWGQFQKKDARGESIEKILIEEDLWLLNDDSDATRIPQQQNQKPTAIDLGITSSRNDFPRIALQILPDCLGSDHLPLLIETKGTGLIFENSEINLKFKINDKTNFEPFNKELDNIDWDATKDENVNIHADKIAEAIRNAAINTLPNNSKFVGKITQPQPNKKYVCWWSKDCAKIVKLRKEALKAYKKNATEHNLNTYKRLKNQATATIREAQTRSWEEFCGSLNLSDSSGKAWKMLKAMQGLRTKESMAPLTDPAVGTITTDSQEKAEIFATQFAHVSSDEFLDPEFRITKRQHESKHPRKKLKNDDKTFNLPITKQEIVQTIRAKRKSAEGDDKISYTMLKAAPDSAINAILDLFNNIWSQGIIPRIFKHAVIVPIPKPDKDKTDPGSYRPISLTSHLGKVLETIINKRLNFHLESNGLYSPNQSGFRNKKQTLDPLIRLETDIKTKNLAHRGTTTAVFLDLEKAYDTMWRKGLIDKLPKYQITGNMFNYIQNFLEDRTFQVRYNGRLSKSHQLVNGTPQGAVISPTLFNLAVNDISENVSNHPKHEKLEIAQYADDVSIWQNDTFRKQVETTPLEEATKNTIKALKSKGFKVNEQKTQAMQFSRQKKRCKGSIKIGNTQIPFKNSAKYLGVHLDETLSYSTHIQTLAKKANKSLNLMKRLRGFKWGATPKTLKVIYQSMIKSRMTYGQEIYAQASPHTLKSLDTIQYKALKIITNVRNNPSYEALCAITKIPPLEIERQTAQLTHWVRVNAQSENKVKEIYSRIAENDGTITKYRGKTYQAKDTKEQPVTLQTYHRTKHLQLDINSIKKQQPTEAPWKLKQVPIDIQLTHHIKKKEVSESNQAQITKKFIEEKLGDRTQIYTDGSKTDRGVTGIGINVLNGDKTCERLTNDIAITTAELVAIERAMQIILDRNYAESAILTDSLSAAQALGDLNIKNERYDIIERIALKYREIENRGLSTLVVWIPSHCGIIGNETADELAKAGTEKDQLTEIGLGKSEMSHKIRKRMTEQIWQNRWNNSETGQLLKSVMPAITQKLPYGRGPEEKLMRVRLNDVGKHDLNQCENCFIKNTLDHALLECPRWTIPRRNMNYMFERHNITLTTKNIASTTTPCELQKSVKEFLTKITLPK